MRSTLLLPLLGGLSLVAAQSALTNDPKWAYSGCYTAPQGHILDYFKLQNLPSAPSIENCLGTCKTRFAALGAGSCYCIQPGTTGLPPTLSLLPNDANCTFACTSSTSEACGGPLDDKEPSALSIYDDLPPAGITFPDWKFDGCVEHFSSLTNFTHVATTNTLTVEGCLNACDAAGLKYTWAGLSGVNCYCSSATPPKKLTFVDIGTCGFSCPGNTAESCGGSYTDNDAAVSLYERTDGPANPKDKENISATGELITRTTTDASAATSSSSSENGNGKNGGAAAKADATTGTTTGAKSTSSSAAIAGGEVGGLFGVFLGLVGWVLAVL